MDRRDLGSSQPPTLLEHLEQRQIRVYALAILTGATVGLLLPHVGVQLGRGITPVLVVLLYGMFAQIPFLQLRQAFSDARFLGALVVSNFALMPALVWVLVQLLPDVPALRLGVCLVLLTPCVDYVVVFTRLGGGDARLMLAAMPLLLLAQLALLPAFLWLLVGPSAVAVMNADPFVDAFLLLIGLPLLVAFGTEYWATRQRIGERIRNATAWLPVPCMAISLFVIVAAQIQIVARDVSASARVVPIYVAFAIAAPLLSKMAARWCGLDLEQSRTLAFSTSTRNSLVVLPLALALPEAWIMVPAVVVTQTMVELVAEVIYVRLVPTVLFPPRGRRVG